MQALLVLSLLAQVSLEHFHVLTNFRIIRHGARVPDINPPHLLYRSRGYHTPWMLTEFGKKQCEEVGQKMRLFDSDYLKKSTEFYSSSLKRCRKSGKAFLKGYLGEDHHWVPTYDNSIFRQFQSEMFQSILISLSEEDLLLVEMLWKALELSGGEKVMETYEPALQSHLLTTPEKLKKMKKFYQIFICNKANGIGTEEFSPQLQRILHRAFKLHYFY